MNNEGNNLWNWNKKKGNRHWEWEWKKLNREKGIWREILERERERERRDSFSTLKDKGWGNGK